MKELDELIEWVWEQYLHEAGIIGECVDKGITPDSHEEDESDAASNRMEAYDRVMREIRAMQERNQQ